jgi:hypothetical protein
MKSLVLEWITDGYVEYQVLFSPGRVAKVDLVEDPALVFRQPWVADGHTKIETEYEYLKIEAEAKADIGSQLLVEVGGELAAGEIRVRAVEPDITGLCKKAKIEELIDVLPQLNIHFCLHIAKRFYVSVVIGRWGNGIECARANQT